MNPKQYAGRKQALAEQRRAQVATLIRAGLHYRQIAEALKVGHSTIGRDVAELRKEWARRRQLVDQEFDLDLSRLDEMLRAVYPEARSGSLPHIQTVLQILDRRGRMLQYDLPAKPLQIEGRLDIDVEDEVLELTDEQLICIAAQALPKVLADPDGVSAN